MNIGISLLTNNIGMTLENVILFVVVLGGFIFYASDVKLGLILHVLMTGLLFVIFYNTSLNYVFSLVSMFIFFVLLALTLMPVSTTSKQGGFV